jgi:hypothetical protein
VKKHLSFANVLSCVALFMALSGVAYAATLGKNAVKTKNIANGAVTNKKVKNSSITAAKIANGAVIGSKIANGAVGASKIADAAVRSSALGGGVVTTGKLKDLGVTEQKLATNAVGTEKLTTNAVATGKIQDGAVSATKLNSGLLAQLVKNVSYETKKSTLEDSSSPKEATATCTGGKVAIGGGAKVIGGTFVALTDSGPLEPNAEGKRVSWSVAAAEMAADGGNWHVEAYVVCAEL